jgi:hypothetical protein
MRASTSGMCATGQSITISPLWFDGMREGRRPVLVGGVEARIERSEAIQRTVRHHRERPPLPSSVTAITVAQFRAAAHPPARKNPP